MRGEQFKAVYDQVGPALVEMFNQGGGMQPMILWVKLQAADDMSVQAAGQVAQQEAVTRLFKDGVAQDLMPLMVRDLLDTAAVPEDLGGGGIQAVVVVGETTVSETADGAQSSRSEALGVWVHSRDRTEHALLAITTTGAGRTCSWREMEVSDDGRRGRLTMHP